MWNGRPLNLRLVHVNDNHFDNRLQNLILLCPNCYSQNKKEKKYAKLVFVRNCSGCDREIPDDDETCKKCGRHNRRPSKENLERVVAILGVDGAARRHRTDEKTVKYWLDSP
jgi:uncharacterized paraquat-inducible protein A